MSAAFNRLKPASGFASVVHYGLLAALPLIVFVLIRLDFVGLAVAVIILSKWRMFAVRPRFWPANVRANAVDLLVGLSVVTFMAHLGGATGQFAWAVAYVVWLVWIKPASGVFMHSLQAGLGQVAGLSALYVIGTSWPLYGLTALTGLICYLTARHYFDSFDETYSRLLSYLWGYFGAALAWTTGHWLLYYSVVAQPTLLLSAVGYGLAALYYLDHHDRLSVALRRQFVFIMLAIILVVLTFSDWGDKVV